LPSQSNKVELWEVAIQSPTTTSKPNSNIVSPIRSPKATASKMDSEKQSDMFLQQVRSAEKRNCKNQNRNWMMEAVKKEVSKSEDEEVAGPVAGNEEGRGATSTQL
jgi:hypothetical protein